MQQQQDSSDAKVKVPQFAARAAARVDKHEIQEHDVFCNRELTMKQVRLLGSGSKLCDQASQLNQTVHSPLSVCCVHGAAAQIKAIGYDMDYSESYAIFLVVHV